MAKSKKNKNKLPGMKPIKKVIVNKFSKQHTRKKHFFIIGRNVKTSTKEQVTNKPRTQVSNALFK